ncbi:peptidase inhibitor family I36 protein [Streptomyces sp. 8K308]|uniref:peptidase inhibitor family I36 protein n=1 Tax=Streptomyces sp. 8K308 TaxID=2530388 RepID=UPI0014048D4F|nr:peptidase inhibitor family I36 protein [Streptomyces sp. 8K308]
MAAIAGTTALTPTAGAEAPQDTGALAVYQDEMIDLSEGWQGAQVCGGEIGQLFQCHETAEEFQQFLAETDTGEVGANARTDCRSDTLCLWEWPEYTGRLLYVTGRGGGLDLADYNFAGITSSVWNNRDQGAHLIDVRNNWPDDRYYLSPDEYRIDLDNQGFNNRTDEVWLDAN